jgi:hypothetical protein
MLNYFITSSSTRNHQRIKKLLLILLAILPTNLLAEERLLESIRVTEEKGYSLIDIRLNQQVTVTSHSPFDSGDLLRIRVKLTGTGLQLPDAPTNRETLPWNPTPELPLYQVMVDLEDGSLMLHFKQSVKYKVRGGTNAFHLFVEVFHDRKKPEILDNPVEEPREVDIKQHAIEGAQNPKLAKAMNNARTAMLEKKYSRAVQLYTKVVLDGSKSIYAKEALEFLGLARERKNQLAHAKVAYKKYLTLYPKGDDADRVKQRLAGILTARAEPKGKLRKGKRKTADASDLQWDTYGSFSQFYNRDETKRNDEDYRLNRSSLENSLDVTSRLRMQDYQVTGRFSGAYDIGLENLEGDEEDEQRISSLYLDFSNERWDTALRVGRQSRSSGGVLGRYDGLLASFPATEKVQLNLVAGYSVDSSRDVFINYDRYFYGISADIGTFFDAWDFNLFFIEQIDHGILDRRAVGGEIRYFEPNRSFFTFVDYDIHHNELNTFLFTGQYIFPDRTTINASYDYRLSPLLTTRSALQGQLNVNSIDELDLTEKEILQLARDRTATSKSFNLGLSRPLTEQFQVNADFGLTNLSGTKTSGGVDGSKGTGNEFLYSTDLTGSSLLTDGDLFVLGFRYLDLNKSNVKTVSLNTRYPITRELRINPRFRFDMKDDTDDKTTRLTFRPSVRVTYRALKHLQLEVEGGVEWEKQERSDAERTATDLSKYDRTESYFVLVGYRLDF